MRSPLRVAICPDFREEGWPSMDRVADQLLAHLSTEHEGEIRAVRIDPPFRRRLSSIVGGRLASNVDRGWNRLIDYPRSVGALHDQYDVFHIVDHSYSQLVHRLPPGRTVVTCHDLDTFRSVVRPQNEERSWAFRAMTRHIVSGFQRAACITCDTAAIRRELVDSALVDPDRVVVAPIGVGRQFSAQPVPRIDRDIDRFVGGEPDSLQILHVGSTIPRKRLDVLLEAMAIVRRQEPLVRLLRVGGALSSGQMEAVRQLGLVGCVSSLPAIDDGRLAALYRRAAMLVLPSDREGFGLPVLEAMRCGTPVVASDIASLREVAGELAAHFPPGNAEACASQMLAIIRERREHPERAAARRERAIAWASQFTWSKFSGQLAAIYHELSHGPRAFVPESSEACPA